MCAHGGHLQRLPQRLHSSSGLGSNSSWHHGTMRTISHSDTVTGWQQRPLFSEGIGHHQTNHWSTKAVGQSQRTGCMHPRPTASGSSNNSSSKQANVPASGKSSNGSSKQAIVLEAALAA